MGYQNSNGQGLLDVVIVGLTWLFNITAHVTKDNVSWALSILVSGLAATHYFIAIRKNTKNKKDE